MCSIDLKLLPPGRVKRRAITSKTDVYLCLQRSISICNRMDDLFVKMHAAAMSGSLQEFPKLEGTAIDLKRVRYCISCDALNTEKEKHVLLIFCFTTLF